jgi:hypothetical protein
MTAISASGPARRTLAQRLAASWPALLYVAIFAWLDWISHRDLLFLLIGFAVVAGLLFAPEILARIATASGGQYVGLVSKIRQLGKSLDAIPSVVRPFLAAIPGLLYLVLRGSGTAPPEMGASVVVVVLALMVAATLFGPRLDARLQPWYGIRDRVPRAVRLLLTPFIAIVLGFLIVHQNLADLPALFGGATTTPRSPAEVGVLLFVLAAALSTIASYLLLHEAQGGAVAIASDIAPEVKLAAMILG